MTDQSSTAQSQVPYRHPVGRCQSIQCAACYNLLDPTKPIERPGMAVCGHPARFTDDGTCVECRQVTADYALLTALEQGALCATRHEANGVEVALFILDAVEKAGYKVVRNGT